MSTHRDRQLKNAARLTMCLILVADAREEAAGTGRLRSLLLAGRRLGRRGFPDQDAVGAD
jgi:hypothetical protein